MKKHEQLIYSAVGLAALLLILVAANYLVSRAPSRIADLTDGKLYTLSPGTAKVLVVNVPLWVMNLSGDTWRIKSDRIRIGVCNRGLKTSISPLRISPTDLLTSKYIWVA